MRRDTRCGQLCLLTVVVVILLLGATTWADSPAASTATQQPVVTPGEEAAGEGVKPTIPALRVVFIDPETGQIISRQEAESRNGAVQLSVAIADALARSDAGLYEEPGAGGGWMVDLRGRFQSVTVATIGEDGAVRLGHVQRRPDQAEADTVTCTEAPQDGGAEQ